MPRGARPGRTRRGTVRVGISGWRYAGWRGNFYPRGLPQDDELAHASRLLGTVEINGTHYSLQRPEYFRRWYDQTPPGFVFAVKGGRYITHYRKLRDIQTPLANFFASGVLALREKLGPILWQFPAFMPFRPDEFGAFLQLLPRTTKEAASLARRHDRRLSGRALTQADRDRPVRHAVEVRHDRFLVPEFLRMLTRHNVAFVITEGAGRWPTSEDVTADFVYARLHGSRKLYVSGYTPRELDRWADRVRAWAAGREPADARRAGPPPPRRTGRDVYVYFDNTDVKQRAPVDAMSLTRRLGVDVPPRQPAGSRPPGRTGERRAATSPRPASRLQHARPEGS